MVWVEPEWRPVPSPDPRLTPKSVVAWLAPVLSEERRRRIEQVVSSRLASVTVVLEHLHDPHNGAAALRTCEAMGLLNVHVVEGADTPFRVSRRVSQHAHKWLNVYLHPTTKDCLGYLRGAGFSCWAAVPPPLERPRVTGTFESWPITARAPTALIFGNEHRGLSGEALRCCDRQFSIPLQGFTESLNLSVSVAVCLQQVVGRRRRLLGRSGDLLGPSLERLRAGYYVLSTRHAVSIVLNQLGLPL